MMPQVISVKLDMTIRRAANLLRGHVIRCLPVVDNGKIKGIITTADFLALIGRGVGNPGKHDYKNKSRGAKKTK